MPENPRLERPPRIRVAPSGEASPEGEAAIELGDAYVGPSYDWQDDVVACWLATRAEGLYACPTCGLLVPRQNGKTKRCVAKRMLYGAGKGESIRYSAHRVDTTMEMFDIFLDLFGNPHKPEDEWPFPELHDEVTRFNLKNGHEKIEFRSGGSIRFVSRSTGAGRGSTVDVNIYDEAQFLTDDQAAASKFASSAPPLGNPQTIYLGTPPSELGVTAEVFGRQRANALAGMDGYCWHEWSVEEVGDVSDRSRWHAANPSLGKALLVSAVESELAEMSPLKFAIERLCYWPEAVSDKAIAGRKWDDAGVADEDAPPDSDVEKVAVGVKFEPGGGRLCVSVAAKVKAGGRDAPAVHVELSHDEETYGGTGWLVDELVAGRGRIACIAIDGRSGGEALRDALAAAGFPRRGLVLMTSGQAVAAATTLVGLLADGRLSHLADQTLDASAKGATRRKVGADGYGFGGDSCPVESAAAAAWAVLNTKRNPNRKMRVL